MLKINKKWLLFFHRGKCIYTHIMEDNKKLVETANKKVAHDVFDLVNSCISYGNKQIKMFIVEDEPWFKGNNIADIFGV